jgi:hypothetical protein
MSAPIMRVMPSKFVTFPSCWNGRHEACRQHTTVRNERHRTETPFACVCSCHKREAEACPENAGVEFHKWEPKEATK